MTQGTKRHVGWLAIGALALSVASSAWAWPIESATLEEDGTDLLFSVKAPAAGDNLPYDVFSLENPNRVVVDLFDADAPTALTGETAAQCLSNFRTSLWKDDPAGRVVRYVFETATPMSYHTEFESGALRVRLTPTTAGKSSDSNESPMVPEPNAKPNSLEPNPSLSPNPVPLDEAPLLGAIDPRSESVVPPAEDGTSVSAATPAGTTDMPLMAEAMPAMRGSHASAQTTGAAARSQALSAELPATVLGQTDAAATKAMNLDVQAADLRTVFRSIAEFGGENIVADRDVEGPISIRLVQTPWRQALDIVCRSAGLVALDEQEGVIRVATLRSYREEALDREASARKREDLMPVVTRVFPVRYASARELKSAVEPALSPRGIAEIDERTNSVIVRDIEARLSDVDALVTALDAETQQVEIVAQLVDLDATATSQLGIDWSIANLHSTSERVSGAAGVTEPLLSPARLVRR